MFGISFSELFLIGIIAVIVIGPEQLPSIARKFGSTIGKFRRLQRDISQQLYQQTGIEDIAKLKDELTATVSEIRYSMQQGANDVHDNQIDLFHETIFYYQPELDFERQPELFDQHH